MDQAEEFISAGGLVGGGLKDAVVADVGGGEGRPIGGGQIGVLQERRVGGVARPRHQHVCSAAEDVERNLIQINGKRVFIFVGGNQINPAIAVQVGCAGRGRRWLWFGGGAIF